MDRPPGQGVERILGGTPLHLGYRDGVPDTDPTRPAAEDPDMAHRITKRFSFDSAHWLPNVPEGHKCGRLHGHTYTVEIALEGELDAEMGWIVDFGEIKTAFKPLEAQLDHFCLNDIEGLENPTAEVMARWLYERMKPLLPQLADITVRETANTSAVYRP
jgi:6-pyruvoyltetrahydropterin/6-carboxytetrahydropterin synthase